MLAKGFGDMSLGIPKVTVLMSVYNGQEYLREAIDSILNQTFTDFEFLIANDHSTDKTVDIIKSYSDPRIHLFHNETNLRLVAPLNKGLELARGKYIVRVDCDDISFPERIATQVAFMDSNSEVGIAGSWMETFGDGPREVWKYPHQHDIIQCQSLLFCPVAQPSAIMNKGLLDKYQLRYAQECVFADDWDLFDRSCLHFPVTNIQQVLVKYRICRNSVGDSKNRELDKATSLMNTRNFKLLKLEPTPEEKHLHIQLRHLNQSRNAKPHKSKDFINGANKWLQKLWFANQRTSHYPEPAFSQVLGERWFVICNESADLGLWTWNTFGNSPLSMMAYLSWKQKAKLAIKCGIKWQRFA